MPSPSRTLAATLLGGVMVVQAAPAMAAETSNANIVIIRPDDVVEDDFYAAALRVLVEGEIDGDLVAVAAEEIVIEGKVTGSVFAFAPTVKVTGSVGQSLRVSSNRLLVEGSVGRDVVAASRVVGFGADSTVAGDVLVWAWRMEALGHVGRDLGGSMTRLDLAGSVERDVDVSVGRLAVVDELTVTGDLGFRSDREAEGLENATVGGAIVHKTPLPPNIRVRALGLFGRFLVILFLTIGALTAAWGWPRRTADAIEKVKGSPLRAWARGAVVMISPFLLAVVIWLILALAPASASFPLLVILGPVVLAALGLVFALSLVAGVPVVGRVGAALFPRLELYGAILAGSALVGLLWLLPIVGWLVPVVVLPLGLGGWVLTWRGESSGEPAEPSSEPGEVLAGPDE